MRAILCDKDGRVILDFGEGRREASQSVAIRSMIGLIESGGLADFLASVRASGVTRSWEMRIQYEGLSHNVLLHGFQTPQGILVFAVLPPRSRAAQGGRPGTSSRVRQDQMTEDEKQLLNVVEVAHDLTNPISSIMSACEYLAAYSQENLNPEQQEMIAEIEFAAATLLRLSQRILQAPA